MPIKDDLQLKRAAKRAINDIARDFRSNHAFFFHNESDVQCRLFKKLTGEGIDVDLIHAEYGMYWDKRTKVMHNRGFYDLVVWRLDKKDAAIDLWGKSAREFSKNMPDIVSIAVEIDYLYGRATEKRKNFETIGGLRGNHDIQKLIKIAGSASANVDSYLILFWDEDVEEHQGTKNSRIRILKALRKLNQHDHVKSLLVSRDMPAKRHGFYNK